MNPPLVSAIVTTKNNHATLNACLKSIVGQTYQAIEIIVVDNNSTDDTKDIAARYTSRVYNQGPERSTQRNMGVDCARGEYVFVIDSDMELQPTVVVECVTVVQNNADTQAVIVPEESFGQGFWAQCKKLERSFYVGQDNIEAARFFNKKLYEQIGGYDETMTGGEDWDLTKRVRAQTKVGRAQSYILHNEGHPRFTRTVKKMYYYGRHAAEYFAKNPTKSAVTDQSGPLERYKLFLSKPGRLLRNPFLGFGMLLLKTSEYAAAGFGMYSGRLSSKKAARTI